MTTPCTTKTTTMAAFLSLTALAGCESPQAAPESARDVPARGGSETLPSVAPSVLENNVSPLDVRCVADNSTPMRADYTKPGPFQVATLEATFEDRSRPISKTEAHSAAPSRTLVTTIYYPTTSPSLLPFTTSPIAAGGPFPLLMYSHGFSSTRSEAETVGKLAASYGYIVVAPDFPLSNLLSNDANPDPADAPNQAGDVSFLIDEVLRLSGNSDHVLARAVDAERIGATGVSMGGLTTLLVSFHPKLADRRIKATAPIAALSSFFTEGFYHTRELPMLLIHGDTDAFIDYEQNSRAAFERARPNARLLTVAGGTHAAFAVSFDPATVFLLNALIGMPDANPYNPDGFGCGGIGSELDAKVPTFPPELGGAANFIDEAQVGNSLDACHGDEYTRPAMDAREQVALSAQAVVAFMDAHLGKTQEAREDACRYLIHRLPEHPALTLE